MRPLLKLEDVAVLLSLSRKTVQKWASVHPEKLPPRTLLPGTNRWRCRPEDFENWLNVANGIHPEPLEPMVQPDLKKADDKEPEKPELISRMEFFRKRRNRG